LERHSTPSATGSENNRLGCIRKTITDFWNGNFKAKNGEADNNYSDGLDGFEDGYGDDEEVRAVQYLMTQHLYISTYSSQMSFTEIRPPQLHLFYSTVLTPHKAKNQII
jgi:hypothetical protein